jgi:hypothetical protein
MEFIMEAIIEENGAPTQCCFQKKF